MTKIKICGMRRPEDIDYVNEAAPDFAGFIFDPTRRRYVEPERAAVLARALAPGIRAVGVFVDAPLERILSVAGRVALDGIQLHGQESEEFIRSVQAATGLPVLRAFRVTSREDVARAVASPAEWILLDNGPGGTGARFDWRLVQDVPRDFMLAGGLDPDNVEEALRVVSPAAVDASSGLETDGWKDREKICRFVAAVRRADRNAAE